MLIKNAVIAMLCFFFMTDVAMSFDLPATKPDFGDYDYDQDIIMYKKFGERIFSLPQDKAVITLNYINSSTKARLISCANFHTAYYFTEDISLSEIALLVSASCNREYIKFILMHNSFTEKNRSSGDEFLRYAMTSKGKENAFLPFVIQFKNALESKPIKNEDYLKLIP